MLAEINVDRQYIEWSSIDFDSWFSQVFKLVEIPDTLDRLVPDRDDHEAMAQFITLLANDGDPYEYTASHSTANWENHLDREFSFDEYFRNGDSDPYQDCFVVVDGAIYKPVNGDLGSSGFYSQMIQVSLTTIRDELMDQPYEPDLSWSYVKREFLETPIYSEKFGCYVAWHKQTEQPVRIHLECYLAG